MSVTAKNWPPVKGDYHVIEPQSRISVVTLASDMEPLPSACMMGSCKTENLGIEKIIINTVSNCNIRYILVCGQESRGHLSGDTLFAIHQNGIDERGRIIGSHGAIPFIENIPVSAVDRFKQQVELIDERGLIDISKIQVLIDKYMSKGDVYPQPPMIIESAKKKRQKVQHDISSGDMMIAPGILMDSATGVVFVKT